MSGEGRVQAVPCAATLTFGEVLFTRCRTEGEHIAHTASMVTVARPDPRSPEVARQTEFIWYDDGKVMAL